MKLLKFKLFFLSTALMGFTSTSVNAEMMEDLTILSPKALAMANAVVADPPAIDSIHFNPAGLTRLSQSSIELKLATFQLKTRYSSSDQRVDPAAKALYEDLSQKPYPDDPYANQSGETGDPILLIPGGSTESSSFPIAPLGGGAIVNPQTQVVFATAVYAPMMVGYTRPEDDLGRYQGNETAISRITYFSPTIALPLSDTLSMGLGINFSYQGIALQMQNRSPQALSAVLGAFAETITGDQLGPGPYDDLVELEITVEDYLSVGFNVGMLWQPQDWLTFGLTYRSPAKSNMEGDFSMKYTEAMLDLTNTLKMVIPSIEGEAVERGKASMELTTPQHIALGTSMFITPTFKLNVDIQRSFYKEWKAFTFEFDQPVDYLVFGSIFDQDATPRSLSLPRNYKNTTSWSIAGEYYWNKNLSLRAGYQRRNSAIPDNAVDLTIPISDADFYGLGFSFANSEDSRFEVGLGYLVSKYNMDYGQSNNANGEDPLDLVYNPYVYLPIKTETRAFLLSMSYVRPL